MKRKHKITSLIISVIILIPIVMIINFVSCGTMVYLPKELLADKDLFLGQNIEKLKKSRKLTIDTDSGFDCYGEINNNKYFSGFSLDCKGFYCFYYTDIINEIKLYSHSDLDSIKVDSLAKEIVNILCLVWGDYTIVDRPTTSEKGILIWNTDKCRIIFLNNSSSYRLILYSAGPFDHHYWDAL